MSFVNVYIDTLFRKPVSIPGRVDCIWIHSFSSQHLSVVLHFSHGVLIAFMFIVYLGVFDLLIPLVVLSH